MRGEDGEYVVWKNSTQGGELPAQGESKVRKAFKET